MLAECAQQRAFMCTVLCVSSQIVCAWADTKTLPTSTLHILCECYWLFSVCFVCVRVSFELLCCRNVCHLFAVASSAYGISAIADIQYTIRIQYTHTRRWFFFRLVCCCSSYSQRPTNILCVNAHVIHRTSSCTYHIWIECRCIALPLSLAPFISYSTIPDCE